MADKNSKNPFDIFKNTGTRHIAVKALGGAKIEIKNALTVEEEHTVRATAFAKQQTLNNSVVPNQSDLQISKTIAVSYLLIEPKMSVAEIGKLEGATKAINEIYSSYEKHKEETEGN